MWSLYLFIEGLPVLFKRKALGADIKRVRDFYADKCGFTTAIIWEA